MKKENFKFALLALGIRDAIGQAKKDRLFATPEDSEERKRVERICKIANDAIAQLEAEVEKLD